MVTYPIRIKRNSYRGHDMRKKLKAAEENRTAVALELHINGQILSQQEPIRSYMYGYIASDTGYPESLVRDLCFSIDCGHNGFTVIKPGLTYEQAIAMNKSGE